MLDAGSFFTLVTGPRRSLSLKLRQESMSLTYEPSPEPQDLADKYVLDDGSKTYQLMMKVRPYLTEMCSGSEAGSYLRLIDFVFHSTPGWRVIKKKKKRSPLAVEKGLAECGLLVDGKVNDRNPRRFQRLGDHSQP